MYGDLFDNAPNASQKRGTPETRKTAVKLALDFDKVQREKSVEYETLDDWSANFAYTPGPVVKMSRILCHSVTLSLPHC